MYLAKLINDDGEVVIHRPDTSSVKLIELSVKKQLNTIDSADIKMLPNNPGFSSVKPLLTRMTVTRVDNNELVFDGRILSPRDAMEASGSLSRSFVAEGFLAYLHDTYPRYRTLSGPASIVVKQLLDEFNAQVEPWKRIELGIVSTAKITALCTPETDMYDTIHKAVVTDGGLEMIGRTENGRHYLDVAGSLGTLEEKPRIEIARNLQTMSVERDPTNVFSRVIPLGKQKESKGGSTDAPRISLADIGKPLFIEDAGLRSRYGVQTTTKIYDTITDAKQLTGLAQSALKSQREVTTKYDITALDLSTIGLDVSDFKLANRYHVFNPLLNVDDDLRVTGVTIDALRPQDTKLTIGDRFMRGTDFTVNAIKASADTNMVGQRVLTISEQVAEQGAVQETFREQVREMEDYTKALRATPQIRAAQGVGNIINYAIIPADVKADMRFCAEISGDTSEWTAGSEMTETESTFSVAGPGTYWLRAKALVGSYSSLYSPLVQVVVG